MSSERLAEPGIFRYLRPAGSMSPSPRERILLSTSPALFGAGEVARALGANAILGVGARTHAGSIVGVVVRTDDPRSELGLRRARALGLPGWVLADGPFRPQDPRGPFSFRARRVGALASAPPSLDAMLRETLDGPFEPDATTLARAEAAIARFRDAGLTLDERTQPAAQAADHDPDAILVLAAELPGPDGNARIERMVEAALQAGASRVLVRGRQAQRAEHAGRVRRVPLDLELRALVASVGRVFVGTDPRGFEALVLGARLRTFAPTSYSGLGLTEDPTSRIAPGRARSLAELVAAAWIEDTHYVDPETGEPSTLERALDHLSIQRAHLLGAGRRYVALGFSPWKQGFLGRFLASPPNRLEFARRAPSEPGVVPVVWGVAQAAEGPVVRMEDGFLRSVGLGSDFHVPLSLVVDARGIYFDPSRQSDLEHLLAHQDFDAGELARAARIRERIVALDVSKYNVGARARLALPAEAADKKVVLVVGQVEDDASIRLGTIDVCTNTALLKAAREAAKDAYVVWKPHPDVTSGNRRGAVSPADAARLADLVVTDVSVGGCLAVADEVHTMTSLVGFEALLRRLRVVVYGHPFYAGWGLTVDRHPHPRRTRARTLDELVAATLFRYARYVHPATLELTTPEAIVDYLVDARRQNPSVSTGDGFTGLLRALGTILGARRGR